VASLRHIFAPESVVVIGASRRREAIGRVILENIRRGGYAGRLYTVNPRARQIDGERCLASVLDLPEPPTWRSSPCRPRPCSAWPSSAASAACGRSW
jgi:acyl-CoA synthetase (NDP forming)